jgi:hypothetical protein
MFNELRPPERDPDHLVGPTEMPGPHECRDIDTENIPAECRDAGALYQFTELPTLEDLL